MRVESLQWNRIRQLPIFIPGRRHLVLLRLGLFLAIAAILATAPVPHGQIWMGWGVLAAFFASFGALYLLPRGLFEATHLKVLVILADTFFLSFVLTISGMGSARLYLFFFLMILIIALGEGLLRILLGAVFLTTVFFFGSIGLEGDLLSLGQLPHPILIPFFAVAALYYGYFVAEVRHREKLANSADRERAELKAILSILETTNSSLDFHTVMQETTVRMAELLNSTRVSIVLVDLTQDLCSVLVSSDDHNLSRLPIRLAKYPEIRQAMETGAPVVIQDIDKSPLMAEVRAELARLGFRSLLVIPLRYGEEIFGTICMRASRADRGFAPDEIRFSRIVASAAANAVKNSLLYRRVKEESSRHRDKARQLQLLFDRLPDLILVLDRRGRIADINRAAIQRTGFRREDIVGRDLTELWPEATGFAGLAEKMDSGLTHEIGEVRLRRQEGPPLEARLTLTPLGTTGGRVEGYLGIAQDISTEKRAQMELLHADRLTSVGELVATVAHELRNRLTGVLGFSQLVAIRNQDPALTRDLERIAGSAEQCKKIVNDLLSFSKKSEPDRKPLGVNGIIQKALDLLERQLEESDINVTQDLQPDLPFCLLDFQQIQQVFVNILTNAQQAIAAHRESGRINVRTRLEGDDMVVVDIEDDGPGMPAEVQPRIFDPFFTTKPAEAGTGLGLSISYGIVESHEGRIEADSRPGHGTRFRVRLPVTREAQKAAVEEKPAAAPTVDQRVLVVDDDPTIVELYMAILKDMGHRVDTANNGVEACGKMRDNRYSLIISDLKMPKMNGLEFLKKIQSDWPDMSGRFVFTTGDLNYMNSHEFIMLSDVPCLVKPLDIQEVERVVGEMLTR